MSLPTISVINFSSLGDQEVQDAIRAVNRQVTADFIPIWGSGRLCVLHASAFDVADEDSLAEEPIRGDSVIYLINEGDLPGALGYHSLNASEMPYGFVFTDLGDWTITLSHEVLELIIDPTANIFVPGSDPRDPTNPDKFVWHTYEVCDAVERTSYEIEHIPVSNFLTPTWFAEGNAPGTRNDFLGVGVDSFRATTGSHLAFYDQLLNEFIPDFIGTAAAPSKAFAKRATAFSCEKPERDEYRLEQVLQKCKSNHKPLSHLRGVSRMARYKIAAQRMLPRTTAGSA